MMSTTQHTIGFPQQQLATQKPNLRNGPICQVLLNEIDDLSEVSYESPESSQEDEEHTA